jgi:thiol:disulfide interchange protein DsbA
MLFLTPLCSALVLSCTSEPASTSTAQEAQAAPAPAAQAAAPSGGEAAAASAQEAPAAGGPAATAQAQAAPAPPAYTGPEILPGRDFTEVPRPERLFEDPLGSIELTYIFSFGCGTCRKIDPTISQYQMSLPEGVVFRRIPSLYVKNEFWMAYGRLFFALEALGKEKELHQAIFAAIQGDLESDGHTHGSGSLFELPSILAFVEGHGISKDDFMAAWESKEVKDNMDRTLAFLERMNINSVPAMAVNGRYSVIFPSRGPGFFLATAEYLVNKEKAEAAAAAPDAAAAGAPEAAATPEAAAAGAPEAAAAGASGAPATPEAGAADTPAAPAAAE